MPEGDNVYQAATAMHAALAGKRLAASDFRVPAFATLDLAGWTVIEVISRGKHLLHRLAPPGSGGQHEHDDAGRLSIHSHLSMEGSWQVYAAGQRWRKPGHTARVALTAEDGTSAVGFSLGVLEVIPTAQEGSAVGHLGPDLLGPDWDAARAEANVRRQPERAVGLALLDQRNLAGIGNIYRCEVCFLGRVHPATPVGRVPDLPGIIATAKRLLEANKSRPRNTVGGFGPPNSTWVYGRAGQPCLRCRTRIEHSTLAEPTPGTGTHIGETRERDIWFCPSCQPLR
ncbi:DNA-formamidopyrimidine glycosylase family protein [Sinomonas sp. ASV486]|uniref:DNA-formamidopyrimidine glycosylase family protein n=1 Tax=Sinomonas sp. ASV486 TaxID=3051170 RepID=UPI0027DE28EC|nr:DNA-formamidopyrimidine glycosylase family protein [Sinomonas sp. ASV486]MDQ4489912.1 DNA-formamidopyrimidine glycosylase family protein [Sinomonas sp. ASV486]